MARIVLGIGTSHTGMFAIDPSEWIAYDELDRGKDELVFPPGGLAMSFQQAVDSYVPDGIKNKDRSVEAFRAEAARCQAALDTLAETLAAAKPDITVIVSDDQDEWYFEDNMPSFLVYWGKTVTLKPREVKEGDRIEQLIADGYGKKQLDAAVASDLGRHVIDHLIDHDFDISQATYQRARYGGRVARRYPTRDGELGVVRDTPEKAQGIPHGFAFVMTRLLDTSTSLILPIVQNTCYPPNVPTSRRCFAFGQAIADAIESWDSDARVAIVASGGLSHFVIDEEFDRSVLKGLAEKDEKALTTLPRARYYSATSESLNWVTVGGALHRSDLNFELVDYVPTYRSEAGTGGGWGFGRWI